MRLITVRDLRVSFAGTPVLRGVHFDADAGERWAIVGESGSGKTTLGRSLLSGLTHALVEAKQLEVAGVDLLSAAPEQLRQLRGGLVSLVMQGSLAALDPLQTIGSAMLEAQAAHRQLARGQAWQHAVEALDKARLSDPNTIMQAYPHQLSGGQRQRACIALATVTAPKLVIADEPTSALDTELAREVCEALSDACTESDAGLLLITHDLWVAAATCTHIAVMADGQIVESGPISRVLESPNSSAAKALVTANALASKAQQNRQEPC